jgi:hypothetical protein
MKTSIKIFFLFSFFFSLFSAQAQAPNRMSYQAVVRNATNALVTNQAVGVRVTIVSGSATGTEVYQETFSPNPTTNINGLLTLEIGTGTPSIGTFAGITWGTNTFFVKTEIDPLGGTNYSIIGTSQLLSVPYALSAKEATNNWGLIGNAGTNPSTNFIGTTDDTDIVFRRNTVIAGRIGFSNNAFGTGSLQNNIGFSNNAFGRATLRNNTNGIRNNAFGDETLSFCTTGSFNNAFGCQALRLNSSGIQNNAFGNIALTNNTTGDNNNAFGNSALRNNTTGNDNNAFGSEALNNNTTGGPNNAFGRATLRDNTTGDNNSGFGHNALLSNTTGNSNNAFGSFALLSNTTGGSNNAFGRLALRNNTTGGNNSAFGNEALRDNISGANNIAIGLQSLLVNTEGQNNVAIGVIALDANTTGDNNTAVGRGSLSNNIIGNSNTAVGREALFNNTGDNNTALGLSALSSVTTGSNNMGLGNAAQVANPANSNQVRIGNTAITLLSAQVALTTTSDSRWKTNIQPSNLGLDFIKQLQPVFYTRKDVAINECKTTILETTSNPTTEYGFIAQDLESALVKFGATNNGIINKDSEGMYGVRYNDLLAPMVKAIQEQQAIIEELKAKIEKLENGK